MLPKPNYVRTNLRNWPKNSQRTRTKLLSAVRGWPRRAFPSLACLCLTTGAILVLRRNYGFAKQTVAQELLLGPCCDGLFAIIAVSCCECYKLYSGKHCILAEGKQIGGETVGLQCHVWLLRNIDSNVKSTLSQWPIECLPYHGLAPSKHLRCMPGDGMLVKFKKVGNS